MPSKLDTQSGVVKPVLLDAYCGAGGCTKGYQRAGAYVVGLDHKPQPNYCGDEFVQMDALEALRLLMGGGAIAAYQPVSGTPQRTLYRLEDFAAIHASPPCQHFSPMTVVSGRPEDHPDLLTPTLALLRPLGIPWVIENVVRAGRALHQPVTICAAALGASIVEDGIRYVLRRHRLFETNFPLMVPPCTCNRFDGTTLGIYGGGTRQDTRKARDTGGGNTQKANRAQAWALMDTPWMTRQEMTQAIPPAYTEHIGYYLMAEINARREVAA